MPQTLGLRELLQVYLDHRIIGGHPTFAVPPDAPTGASAPGARAAHRDPRHRRGHPGHPHQRRRAAGPCPPDGRVRPQSTLQADYILELQLRRLTKFSRIELENERDKLQAEIAELETLLGDPCACAARVADELDEVAERFGTRAARCSPRRKRRSPRHRPHGRPPRHRAPRSRSPTSRRSWSCRPPAEPCASTCPTVPSRPRRATRRNRHDAILSTRASTTSRGELGASRRAAGWCVSRRSTCPSVPANSVQLAAGAQASTDYLGITDKKERVLGLVSLDVRAADRARHRSGHREARGARRLPVAPGLRGRRAEARRRGRRRRSGPGQRRAGVRHLRCPAAALLGVGGAAAGRRRRRHGGHRSAFYQGRCEGALRSSSRAIDPGADVVVATISTPTETLAGADPGRAKVSRLAEFPGKGRATGGVRAHTFLKGESALSLAWAARHRPSRSAPTGRCAPSPTPAPSATPRAHPSTPWSARSAERSSLLDPRLPSARRPR